MAHPDSHRPVQSSDRLGRYEILLPIASGGMASVYLAVGLGITGFERQVAVKLIHPHLQSDKDLVESLLNEGKLAVRIRHRHVVAVLDVGLDRRGMYLVMEYIEGDSLSAIVRAARAQGLSVPAPVAMRILIDALSGLHAAHELQDEHGLNLHVVHRDFSPQNILVSLEGVALLTDFGIAKATTSVGHTKTGIVKGKISYLSPEQVQLKAVDRRADVWAAGVVAWEIFAGRALRRDGNQLGTLLEIISSPPPPLRAIRPEVSEAIESAVASALHLDPARRLPTAKALRDALLDACPSRTDVADVDEVAAFVQKTVGAKLRERRARLAKVLEIRTTLGRIAQQVGTLEDSADDLIAVDPSILPLPRALRAHEPDRDDPGFALGPAPRLLMLSETFEAIPRRLLSAAAVSPEPIETAPTPEPAPIEPPSAARAPEPPAAPAADATPSEPLPCEAQLAPRPNSPLEEGPVPPDMSTDTISVTKGDLIAPRRSPYPALAAITLAGLVLIGVAVMSLRDDPGAAGELLPGGQSDAVVQEAVVQEAAAADAIAASRGMTDAGHATVPRRLIVRANVPIVRLEHAGAVSSFAPATAASLDWAGTDPPKGVAIDTHGRRAAFRVPPGASTVYVRFGPPIKGPSRPPASKGAAPLASDPY